MKSNFEFDNVQLEADFSDFETMQAYEQAMEMLVESSKKVCTKASERILFECECINKAFDMIFGEGSAKRIFKGKINRDVAYSALYALHDHVAKAQILSNEKIKEMASKYQRG